MLSEGRLELPNLCKVVATMQTNITLGIVEDDTFFIRKDRMFITLEQRKALDIHLTLSYCHGKLLHKVEPI
jgi:hypothetical protein